MTNKYNDPVIKSQNFALISFSSKNKNINTNAIKIRGVFDLREDAEKYAQYLTTVDPHYNIYCAQVGEWCPLDDDITKAEKMHFYDEKEQLIMDKFSELRHNLKNKVDNNNNDEIRNELQQLLENSDSKDINDSGELSASL